jgi:hypothetical protein
MADTALRYLTLPAHSFPHQPKRNHTIGFKESLIRGNHQPEFCELRQPTPKACSQPQYKIGQQCLNGLCHMTLGCRNKLACCKSGGQFTPAIRFNSRRRGKAPISGRFTNSYFFAASCHAPRFENRNHRLEPIAKWRLHHHSNVLRHCYFSNRTLCASGYRQIFLLARDTITKLVILDPFIKPDVLIQKKLDKLFPNTKASRIYYPSHPPIPLTPSPPSPPPNSQPVNVPKPSPQ